MKIIAIIGRVLKEMLRDKRTLALMFLAPILILTLMYFIFNGDENDLKIGIDTSVSSNITKQLPSSDIKTQTFHSHENIKSKIEKITLMVLFIKKIKHYMSYIQMKILTNLI